MIERKSILSRYEQANEKIRELQVELKAARVENERLIDEYHRASRNYINVIEQWEKRYNVRVAAEERKDSEEKMNIMSDQELLEAKLKAAKAENEHLVDEYHKERSDAFNQAARPLIKWLAENCNPHMHVIVNSDSAELVCGEMVYKTDEYILD